MANRILFIITSVVLLFCACSTPLIAEDKTPDGKLTTEPTDTATMESSAPETVAVDEPVAATCSPFLLDKDPFEGNVALQQAHKKFKSGKWKDAAAAFETAMQAEISENMRHDAEMLTGIAFYNASDFSKALPYLDKTFNSGNLRTIVAEYATKAAYSSKEFNNAIKYATLIVNDATYRTYRGLAFEAIGNYSDAVTDLNEVKKFPKNLQNDALAALARAQVQTANIQSALLTFQKIYDLDPKSEQGQIAKDQILALKDQWPENFKFPKPEKTTDAVKSKRDIAIAHFNAHRSEEAIKAFGNLLKSDKKEKKLALACDDMYYIARSYVKLRKHSQALPHFKQAIKECESTDLHIKLLYAGAKAAWNAGEPSTAIDFYKVITTQYPKHSYADDAYHFQAQILLEKKTAEQENEAIALLKKQIELYPDGDMAKDSYWALFSHEYDNQNWKEAIEFSQKISGHSGEDDFYSQGRLTYFTARAHEQLGQTDKAKTLYQENLANYPLTYYAMLSLGRLNAIDKNAAVQWISEHRPDPKGKVSYCFSGIASSVEFSRAQHLAQLGLYGDALSQLDSIPVEENSMTKKETEVAKAMLQQKQDRFSTSAKTATPFLNPKEDYASADYSVWRLAYPRPWATLVAENTKKQNLPEFLVYAIMREESMYNPKAESWANARGLMQLMLPTAVSTAKEIGFPEPKEADLFKPENAIPIGAAYLAKLTRLLAPHVMLVIPGYNAGQGNLRKWMTARHDVPIDIFVEKIPYKEARQYAKRVSMTLWRYRWLYSEESPIPFDPAETIASVDDEK